MQAAARSQLQSTLAGGYLNPYLNPYYSTSGRGCLYQCSSTIYWSWKNTRRPSFSTMVATQTALAALPYAFQNVNTERARQLQVAQQAPNLFQTGQGLEALTRQAQMSPFPKSTGVWITYKSNRFWISSSTTTN
jgi:hypothetical protein